ncbi:MAG TPA: potassium channel protein [Bacteroidia bacterium]|jgi:voltage-gated potassium channel|nr:potassium channel protein [Bacteroidia bacterium]
MFNELKSYSRFLLPLYLLMGITVLGTVGYQLICGYNFIDAFYMTIITIATVGFEEVHPLDMWGKIFTAFLVMISFGIFAYSISAVTRFVFDGEFNQLYKNRKLNETIKNLNDHVIICGYGRNGRQAAQVLKKHKQRFIVIEKSAELTATMQHQYSDLVINADATLDDVLLKAGILRAKALVTTLPIDADNLFIVLTARNLNPALTIISRASEDNSDTKLKIAGANNVIMPDKVGGAHMASLIMKPDVIEFIDHIVGQEGDSVNMEEITFENIPERLRHKTLRDLEIRNKSGANIIGFKTAAGEYIINPDADTRIIPSAKIFVLGNAEQIKKLKELLT